MERMEDRLNIIQDYEMMLTLTKNDYAFASAELLRMAARINKKRGFLFVSTVLGKHLAVPPQMPLLTGALLAMIYAQKTYVEKSDLIPSVVNALKKQEYAQEVLRQVESQRIQLPEETLFIGFAETATALGHAVFKTFQSNATYIHTTREQIADLEPFVTFEEEHSHATSHRLYVEDTEKLLKAKRIVLIDDEITTGNTVINIIETLRQRFPDVKDYTILSILDWRSASQRKQFEQLQQQWGMNIQFYSIVSGTFTCIGTPLLTTQPIEPVIESLNEVELLSISEKIDRKYYRSIAENGKENNAPYMMATGRLALTAEQHQEQREQLGKIARKLKSMRKGGPTLVVGTGEFMYVPMQLAAEMGEDVYFQSTTRSPIYHSNEPDYTITEKIAFDSPENNGVENYLYNIEIRPYSELFLIVERIANKEAINSITKALQSLHIENIHIICMHELEGGE
ncbi:MAG: phosphoribosyltransferase family protein [Lysinibacillus sp.]